MRNFSVLKETVYNAKKPWLSQKITDWSDLTASKSFPSKTEKGEVHPKGMKGLEWEEVLGVSGGSQQGTEHI